MPWNEADRAKYEVIRDRYSSDMSDAEFERISGLLPLPKRRGHFFCWRIQGGNLDPGQRHCLVLMLRLALSARTRLREKRQLLDEGSPLAGHRATLPALNAKFDGDARTLRRQVLKTAPMPAVPMR